MFDEEHDEAFEKAKRHAIYYSDRTRVVVVPDEFKNLIPDGCIANKIGEDIPTIKRDGRAFVISDANHDVLYFLGVFSQFGEASSLKSMQEVAALLDNKLVEFDDKTKSDFSPLPEDACFKDLNLFGYKFRINRKNQGYDAVVDVKLADVFSDVVIKDSVIEARDVDLFNTNSGKDTRGMRFVELYGQYFDGGNKVDVNVRSYCGNMSLIKLLNNSNSVNVKFVDDKPVDILPFGFKNTRTLNQVSPSKESKKLLNKMPVALFRFAYYEWFIRNKILIGE